MTVEVPVFGKMVVPEGTNPDELMAALGKELGVDINKQITTGQAVARGVERGITGTMRGIGQVFGIQNAPAEDVTYDAMGNVISGGTAPSVQEQRTGENAVQADLRKEFEYELAKLQGNKAAAMGGYALGTIGDPINLFGGLGAATVRSLAVEGVIAGGVQGFFDPLYGTDATTSNRVLGAGVGAAGGGILGTAIGKVAQKFGLIKPETPGAATKGIDVPDTAADNVAKEMEAPLAETVTPTVVKPADEVITPADQTLATPTPSPATAVDETINQILTGYEAKLPPGLAKAAPRYGRDVVGFESDLDRALYIVRDGVKRSAADQKFMDWIKASTGIQDETLIRSLGAKVRDHVAGIPDKGVIPPSMLELPTPVVKQGIGAPTAPFVGTTAKLGNGIDPLSNAWNSLDNPSKNLYNIGRKFLDFDATGVKPKLSPIEQKEAFDAVRAIDPAFKREEMPDLFRSYSKVLDNLYEIRGKDYTPPSLGDLMKNKLTHEDFTDLFNRGVFDGCAL